MCIISSLGEGCSFRDRHTVKFARYPAFLWGTKWACVTYISNNSVPPLKETHHVTYPSFIYLTGLFSGQVTYCLSIWGIVKCTFLKASLSRCAGTLRIVYNKTKRTRNTNELITRKDWKTNLLGKNCTIYPIQSKHKVHTRSRMPMRIIQR